MSTRGRKLSDPPPCHVKECGKEGVAFGEIVVRVWFCTDHVPQDSSGQFHQTVYELKGRLTPSPSSATI